MKSFIFTLLLTLTTVLSLAQGVQCIESSQISTILSERYNERLISQGIAEPNLLQTYANESTGSWTIVIVKPDNRACMFASGQNFELMLEELPPNL